jgi:two-component system NtrC family sensor kinase
MKRRIRSIGTRLVVTTAVVIVLLLGILAVVMMNVHRQDLMQHVRVHANQLSGTVKWSLYYSMMQNDRENIKEAIRNIGKEEGIEIARIFNKAGEIIYSSDDVDLGGIVPKTSEGCIQCHASDTPVVELRPDQRSRIFEQGDQRSFGVVTPIYNEAACSKAPCHVHPSDQKVLGVMYITMSLRNVDRELHNSSLLLLAFTLGTIVVLSVFLMIFVRRFVKKPVQDLMEGVNRVAAGDMDHPIAVPTRTEIGDLARAFNRMTVDLKKARGEIEEWGRSLEDRVRERTGELEAAQAQLMQSEKLASLGKLSASVAHEINNPLMGILTFIRTFQDWSRGENFPSEKIAEFREYLEIMGKETMRISKIVRNLLAFARKSKMIRELQDINRLLQQSVDLLDHKLGLSEIEIIMNLDQGLSAITVDGGQIQQTFMNLILNAAEAMGKGGVLTLTTALAEEKGFLSITVKDTGPGISDDVLDKLFDPFFTTKEVGQGTGLGLPVAYGIVHNHGGSIRVRSKVGEGSEFEILLPIDSTEEANAGQDAEEA